MNKQNLRRNIYLPYNNDGDQISTNKSINGELRALRDQIGVPEKHVGPKEHYIQAYDSDNDRDEVKYPVTKIVFSSNHQTENIIYMCTLCHSKFKAFKSLQRHVENMHIGWKSFMANRNKSTNDDDEEIQQREKEAVKRKKIIQTNIPDKRQKLSKDYSAKRRKIQNYIR